MHSLLLWVLRQQLQALGEAREVQVGPGAAHQPQASCLWAQGMHWETHRHSSAP